MKKQIITIAIVLGLSMTSFAQGGLFHRGANTDSAPSEVSFTGNGAKATGDGTPMLPNHNQTDNTNAPLGSGIALLTALGAGYMVAKRRKE